VKSTGAARPQAVEPHTPREVLSEKQCHAAAHREHAMTSKPWIAATLLAFASFATFAAAADAQTAPPADANASMVKPPSAAGASATRPNNPDNMPVKRPAPPPNSDRMLHNSPASDAIAK
jgi:hypothetical protein